MGMGKVFVRRGINVIVVVSLVLIINFLLFRVMPGDPAMMMLSDLLTAEYRAVLIQKFGLDLPLHIQFIKYIQQLSQGNLGISFLYRRPVSDIIIERMPATILLLLSSYIITVILSVSLGLLAAWKRGSKTDLSLIIFGQTLNSMPIFWLGGLLLLYLSVQLDIFPLMGLYRPWIDYENVFALIGDILYHLFLPMMTLGISNIGGLFLITRNSLLDVFTEDYILTARAIGLDNRTILFRNALRNAMLPLTTIIMIRLGFIVSGAILTETVFTWPGIGQVIHSAVVRQDFPLLQGIFLVITVSAVIANFISEIIYGYLDPRVRYE